MNKIYTFGLAIAAIAALAACNKDNAPQPHKISVEVTTEMVGEPDSKVSISESGSIFSLDWGGSETLGLGCSTSTNNKKDWVVSSYSGRNATLTGSLPDAEATKTNWLLATNFFSSATSVIRAVIPPTQSYNGVNLADNCLLVGRVDDASASTVPAMDFKTMNAFLKFSLLKGSAAPGSSNTYTKMYVQNIIVEALGSEPIAGRFEIDKIGSGWSDAYSGTVAGQTSTAVTLDCTANDPKGEELSAVAKDFYVAIAFGDYDDGLKITINVLNQDGDAGKLEKTFGATSGVSISRNTMRALSTLTVNPEDVVVTTYSLITDPNDLVDGEEYFMAANMGLNKYHLFTGELVKSSSNYDCGTVEYTYNPSTKVLTGSGAVAVTLTATGVANKYAVTCGGDYLITTAKTNRRLALGGTEGYWTFSIDARGGMTMLNSNYACYLVTSTASSNVLRNYTSSSSGNYGVYFFHED